MSNLTFSVFKIFTKNIFSFGNYLDGFKKGPKGIIKNIFIALAAVYCVCAFVFMYGMMMYSSYSALQSAGNTSLFPLLTMILATYSILMFGFLSAASNYYTGCGEEQFMSMPLSAKNIFGAKFGVTFITDAVLGFALFTISSGYYGYKEHLLTNPLFYLGYLTTVIAISVVAVFVIYFLLIVILYFVPAFRKRSFLSGIASLLVIIFALTYSMFSSNLAIGIDGEETKLIKNLRPLISNIAENNPVLMFLSDGVNGNIWTILVMLAISAFVIFVLIPAISGLYLKTLNGFSDQKTKKLNQKETSEVFAKGLKRNSVFKSLYIRDVRTVLREPAFLTNGPLVIILVPIIFIFSFFVGFMSAGEESIGSLLMSIQTRFMEMDASTLEKIEYYFVVVASGLSIFLGTSTSIAATSFSREGKSLYDLKAMPIETETIVAAKLWHAITYVFVSILMVLIILIAGVNILSIPFPQGHLLPMVTQIIMLSITPSILLIYLDMFLDTVNPKLLWENPMAAFKQNANSIFSVLITMGLVAIYAGAVYLLPKNSVSVIGMALVFGIIAAPIGNAYTKYAKKKFPLL